MGVECDFFGDFAVYAILPNGKCCKVDNLKNIDLEPVFITNNGRRYNDMKPLRRFRKKGQRKYWRRFKSHVVHVSGTMTDCATSSDTL